MFNFVRIGTTHYILTWIENSRYLWGNLWDFPGRRHLLFIIRWTVYESFMFVIQYLQKVHKINILKNGFYLHISSQKLLIGFWWGLILKSAPKLSCKFYQIIITSIYISPKLVLSALWKLTYCTKIGTWHKIQIS